MGLSCIKPKRADLIGLRDRAIIATLVYTAARGADAARDHQPRNDGAALLDDGKNDDAR